MKLLVKLYGEDPVKLRVKMDSWVKYSSNVMEKMEHFHIKPISELRGIKYICIAIPRVGVPFSEGFCLDAVHEYTRNKIYNHALFSYNGFSASLL